ncbi:Fc.00g015610.m01.CDS01 [Cosmosporella sp. VM-42]
MAKPRLIILVRHGQSEGNKNREIHQTIPDHRVKLTSEGWNQAHDAGRRLRRLLRPDDTLQVFTSPYRRTRETTEGILSTLTSDEPDPSPFRRSNIKVYEEPRLREQDFGNFQPCSAEMERMWQERADYGHFFYRIPNGESAADAYDRVSGFNESLWRQFGEDDFASVCVLVTHGLMSRVFLMKWYHFTVEYFEDLRNINHCEFLIMRKQDNGKYFLQNNLRTWSELKKERAIKDKDKDKEKEKEERDREERDKDGSQLQRSKTFIVTRKWGGCPNGCNHSSHYTKRDDLELLRQKDVEHGGPAPYGSSGTNGSSLTNVGRRERMQQTDGSSDEHHHELNHIHEEHPEADIHLPEDVDSSPNGTPSFISADDRLRNTSSPHLYVGRDGGGTYSGHTSVADSDTDNSEDEHHSLHRVASLNAHLKSINGRTNGATDEKTDPLLYKDDNEKDEHRRTNRLGDASPDSSEEGDPDLDQAEREDRSIQGSVY